MHPSILVGAACVMTAALGTAASAAEEHNSTATPVVVALGDSLTAGYGLQRTQAYPALLQAEAANAGFRHRVLNAGVSGETSSDIARRFDRDVPAGTRVLILAAGANDGLLRQTN